MWKVQMYGIPVKLREKEDRVFTLKLSAPINKSVLLSFPRERAAVQMKSV